LTSSIRGQKDFWTGLIYIFFGVSALLVAREYGMGTGARMGPGYFPTVLGALLSAIGGVAVIRSFIVPGAPIGAFAFKGAALVGIPVLMFGLIVRGAGLAVALPLLVVISASASAHFRWRPTLLIASALTIFCILVFLKGLGIPLPVIGSWFGG
jgi:putative tricarboxylic transport membrane protein